MGMKDLSPLTPGTRPVPARMSLSAALFSGTQQKVLGLLLGQPDRSFYANELIVLARSGSGAVQRELARLVHSELVTVRLVYNAAHALCLAALRWHGYRSGNRYIVFQLLPHTLKVYPGLPHGMCATHPEVINPDLLAFFKT